MRDTSVAIPVTRVLLKMRPLNCQSLGHHSGNHPENKGKTLEAAHYTGLTHINECER